MSDSTYYHLVKAMVSGEGKDFRQQELQVLSGNDYYNICGVWIQIFSYIFLSSTKYQTNSASEDKDNLMVITKIKALAYSQLPK